VITSCASWPTRPRAGRATSRQAPRTAADVSPASRCCGTTVRSFERITHTRSNRPSSHWTGTLWADRGSSAQCTRQDRQFPVTPAHEDVARMRGNPCCCGSEISTRRHFANWQPEQLRQRTQGVVRTVAAPGVDRRDQFGGLHQQGMRPLRLPAKQRSQCPCPLPSAHRQALWIWLAIHRDPGDAHPRVRFFCVPDEKDRLSHAPTRQDPSRRRRVDPRPCR
jgi:hypothetical protein